MKKTIDEKFSRIKYEGNINELKNQLIEIAKEMSPFSKELTKCANYLEKIFPTDYLENNFSTMYEKIYFNKKHIIYGARDDFIFPIVKKRCLRAEKRFLEKNPECKINKKTKGHYYLIKNFVKRFIEKF